MGLEVTQWVLPNSCNEASRQNLLPAPIFAHAAALSGLGYES